MRYKIETSTLTTGLMAKVELRISEGYTPLGGVCGVSDGPSLDLMFFQALYRKCEVESEDFIRSSE